METFYIFVFILISFVFLYLFTVVPVKLGNNKKNLIIILTLPVLSLSRSLCPQIRSLFKKKILQRVMDENKEQLNRMNLLSSFFESCHQ